MRRSDVTLEDLLLYEVGYYKHENEIRKIPMDKKIKNVKKSLDKKMDTLVKEDVKRDKACDAKCGTSKKSKGMKK